MESAASVDSRAPHTLSLADFDYALPAELIAQVPPAARDGGRLLVMERESGAVQHEQVRHLPAHLRRGDVLVLNDTRVRPARLYARTASGGAVEVLLLADTGAGVWKCLGRPAKRLRPGAALRFAGGAAATVCARLGAGCYAVAFEAGVDVSRLLSEHGEVPLPPYIKRPDGPLPFDRERYQTVFAAREGAVAAPTAGLHFTPALLERLRATGVELAWLTLHVGPATFLPVRSEDVRRHRLEPERAYVPPATADAVRRAKSEGRRIVAVGTTTTRALESAARDGGVDSGERWADAFIVPGFRFRVVDVLLTNFHLPRSTLLMLVCAFAGRQRVLDAYATAVRERYRFYSYGDAMLIT